MNNIARYLLFLVGITLWVPGISLFNVGNSWGLQISMMVSWLLLILMILNGIINKNDKDKINVKSEMLTAHAVIFSGLFVCTLFSPLGVERSILPFVAEILGILFSLTLSWWLCNQIENIFIFLKGFLMGGIISSIYALYQFVGLKIGLPFAYLSMNNPSFSILDNDSAIFHGRALAITSEPSILASLILIVLGMSIVDLLLESKVKNYILTAAFLIALMATGSQSIILVPIYILLIVFFVKPINVQKIRRKNDFIGIIMLVAITLIMFAINPDLTNIFSRLSNVDTSSAKNDSATSRFYDIAVYSQMFLNKPLFGNGLGSITDLSETVRVNLKLDGDTGATSSLFRSLAEQGIVALIVILTTSKVIDVPKIRDIKIDEKKVRLISYIFAIILSLVISLIFFIGYRTVYHTWLIVPMLLCLKSYSLRNSTETHSNVIN